MTFPSKHFIRFLERMAPVRHDNEIVIVLTGHLLIEELLVATVEKSLKHPDALSRFLFYDYLFLARAHAVTELPANTLDTIESLNRLRNQLAHNLDDTKYQSRRREFLDRFKEPFPQALVNDFGEMWCALMALHSDLCFAVDFDPTQLRLGTLLCKHSDRQTNHTETTQE
jgi:hypothetical protein